MRRILSVVFLSLILLAAVSGCKRGPSLAPGEKVISRYPLGEIKETAIISGAGTNSITLKSFVYHISGQKKKEYNYKNNLYFGPWKYWYKKGGKLAEGTFDTKTPNPNIGVGTAVYYWPGGKKMIEIDTRPERQSDKPASIYHDEKGNSYTDQNLPEEVRQKIVDTIHRWDIGEI